MAETSLSVLMKEIGEALKLDDDCQEKEAYVKYVGCIYKITANLILAIKLSGGDVAISGKTSRQVKLLQQCVDRVAALVEKMVSDSGSVSSAATTPVSPPFPSPLTPSQGIEFKDSQPKSFQPLPLSSCGSVSSPMTPNASSSPLTSVAGVRSEHPSPWGDQRHPQDLPARRFTAPVPALPEENNPHSYSASKSKSLTPMEMARKRNQSLMVAYRARMNRLNRSDFNAFSYSLTIQRKMAENLAIAQAQEEVLAKKMEARQQRLEEEAARRFASPSGITEEEQEQRLIYKKILEYENEAKWLQTWRKKLEANPEDPILISQLVQEILRCSDHPFTELLRKYQFKIYERLYPLVAGKHDHLAQVKVPLPQELWPTEEEVSDILKACRQIFPQSPEVQSPRKSQSERSRTSCGGGGEKRRKTSSETDDVTVKEDRHDRETNGSERLSSLKSTDSKEECSDSVFLGGDEITDSKDEDPLRVRTNSEHHLDVERNDASLNDSGRDQPAVGENACSEENGAVCNIQDKSEICDKDSEGKTIETLPSESVRKEHGLTEKHEDSKTKNESKDGVMPTPATSESVGEKKSQTEREEGENSTVETTDTTTKGSATESSDEETVSRGKGPVDMAENTKGMLEEAMDKGSLLKSQLSWQRKQAQMLMQQVTRDYENYNQENFDDLFDDDDSESSEDRNAYNAPSRSLSYQPASGNAREDLDVSFQSLPIPVSERGGQEEKKKWRELNLEAYKRHLKSISEDVHGFLEKLLVMMTIAYEPLDTPVGKDQCAVSLEEPFFKPIWKTLRTLFQVVNQRQELILACVMTNHASVTPEGMEVSKKLCLNDPTSDKIPYQRAIEELCQVQNYYTMLSKLDCVVKVCRLICECVDDFYGSKDKDNTAGGTPKKKAPSLGADDLLPILSYVVIRTSTPTLVSECQAMSEFIHEGYVMGEEGYCLTSLKTALNYLTSLAVLRQVGD